MKLSKFTRSSVGILFAIIIMFSSSLSANADYSTAHVLKGSNTNGGAFQYWCDSSVDMYGYRDGIVNAQDCWSKSANPNSIANLWEISQESLAQIKFYVVENELPAGVFGDTGFYKSNGTHISATNVINGTNFDIAVIRYDHGRMTAVGFTWAQRLKTEGHEVGHALSLNHFENSPAHSGNHWMKSGQISLTSPTTTDKDHLAYKW